MGDGRMRRVDEAVRAVLSDAIAKDLQDPRVGFVTVTAVKTSPDLRHARVYVSVLGDERARAETLEGLRSAHGFLQGRVAAELSLKHTPMLTLRVRRVGRSRHAHLAADRAGAGRGDAVRTVRGRPPETRSWRSSASAEKLIVVTHENVDGDALGSLIAMQEILTAQGQRQPDVHRRERVPAAQRVPLLPALGAGQRAARGPRGAHDRVPGLRQPRAQPGRGVPAARARTSSTSTTTTTTPGSAPSTTCCPRRRARPRSSGT